MGAQDPYGQAGYGMPPNPYGGGGYGMMGGGQMHGNYGGMGGGPGGRGTVPFRAGDWRCGNEGCGYHNFAKNVACLRCGASRNTAAVVGDGNPHQMANYPGSQYGGPPPHMSMAPMDPSQYGGMGPGSAYGGSAVNIPGAPPGGFGNQGFGPASAYLPSGLGAPSPYMPAGYAQMANNGQGGFDSRAEQAFNQGNASATGGASVYSNGYGTAGGPGNDGGADPFSFLNAGMGNLGLGDREERRNGQGAAKSPQ